MRTIHSGQDIVGLTLELSRLLRRKTAQSKNGNECLNIIRVHGLSFILDHGSVTMTEFARYMNISPSSATAFADRLAAEGLVKRIPMPKNRKAVQLKLTPNGLKELKRATAEKEKVLSEVFSVLSAADRRDFSRILSIVVSSHSA